MLSLDLFHGEPTLSVPAGATLIEENELGNVMYVVASGTFEIRVHNVVVEEVGRGGVVGEMALIDHKARSASVVAAEAASVVAVDEKRFLFLVQHHPYFALDMMRLVVERLRSADTFVPDAR